jgi:hypothetical protein
MNSGIIGGLGTAIAFAIFRRVFPYRPPAAVSHRPLEELVKDYRKWELFAIVPFFLLVTALSILWYLGLRLIADWRLSTLKPNRFLLVPIPIIWALPAFFLGIISASLPLHLLYSALLEDRYEEYTLYCNLRIGFDSWKVFRWTALIFLIACGAGIGLVLNWYTRLTDDAIYVRHPLSFDEVRYPYSRVAAIAYVATFTAPNGNIVHRPYFAIRFDDGTTWTTRSGLRDPQLNDWGLMEFVSKAARKPILSHNSIDDLDRGGLR